MIEQLEAISTELYDLNNNLQTFMFIFAEIMGRPLESLSSNGDFKFKEKAKSEVTSQ